MAKKSQAKASFLQTLVFHFIIAIILSCILLCFYPYWFPSLYNSPFLYISIPNILNFFYSPKCLFIVVNVIVIFLLGESKIFGSRTCPVKEIYDEYVKRSRNNIRGISTLHQEKIITNLNHEDKRVTNFQEEEPKEEIKQVIKEQEQVEEETFQEILEEEDEMAELINEIIEAQPEEAGVIIKEEENSEERERESVWPAEELNRRVEEFIARVNRQRWIEEARLLESRVLVSCSA